MTSLKQSNSLKKKQENIFSNIKKIIDYFYYENFTGILIEEKSKFLNKIDTKILELLKYQYKDNEIKYQKELALYEKNKDSIYNRYESDIFLLNLEYKKYRKFPSKISYLMKYRKHCLNSENIPIHKCSSNKFGKFIEVLTYNNISIKNKINLTNISNSSQNTSYVICSECKTCYVSSFIKMYCPSCQCNYFSSKLKDNENENILPATWKEYHCQPIIVNEIMKCIKCEKILYLNLVTKRLVCLNKKCNFSSNPHSIIWKCKICKTDFRSSAKVFNPLENKILQNELSKCLLYKIPALPKKLFCCTENENNKNIKFYHNKKCRGELFKWSYEDREIIVCSLCHAVNFYEKFIWTCPICNLRLNYHGKKPMNEKENHKNLLLSNISKKNIKISSQNYNTEIKEASNKKIKEKDIISIINSKNPIHRHTFSTNIKIFTTDENVNNKNNIKNYLIEDKKVIFENNFSIQSIEASNTLDYNKNNYNIKNKEDNLKKLIDINHNNMHNSKNSKRKKKGRYQTLFDILEEREKYKINNQSRDENINNENLTNAKIKVDEYFSKKRIRLLGESKPKTSMKKEKKTLFQNYFIKSDKKNIIKNNLINKYKYDINKKVLGNNIINISDSEENNILNNEELELIKKNLKKKLSGDLNKYSSNIINDLPASKNSDSRISNFKDKLYSKIYKDEQSIIANEEIKKINKKSKSKKKDINRNESFRYLNIDKKKNYIQESNNTYVLRNISTKKNSENRIKRKITMLNYEKDFKKYSQINNNNLNPIEYKENNDNNKDDLEKEKKFNDDIKSKSDKKAKEKELKKENEKNCKNNQIFKRIFLNKIKYTRNSEKEHLFKENNSQKDILKNSLIKNLDMKISALGDIGQDIVSKDDFLKIANECKIPSFDENNINYINPIGQGSYGVIYLVEDKKSKKEFALKRVLCQDIQQILKHKKEFELCYSLSHPNIIKIYNVLFKYLDITTYSLYVLMEKAETDWNTEILKRVKTKNYYSETELINIMKQLVSALLYFQNNNIAHRDIKPPNILICRNNIYKLTDLGEAKRSNNNTQLATLKGSQLFMSPNLFFVLKYDGKGVLVKHNLFKSDVFSLGYCFLYAMSLDLRLIKSLREETSMIDVLSILKRFGIENMYSEKFLNIIYKMIQTDENKRFDFIELNEEINKIL